MSYLEIAWHRLNSNAWFNRNKWLLGCFILGAIIF